MHGSEPLLVDELVDRLAAVIFPDAAAAAWNREVLHADTVTPETIVAAGSALPLFGGRRLVLVRGLAAAPPKVIDRLREAIDRARGRAGGWPAEGTTIALLAAGTDRRAAALRLVPDTERVEVRAPVGRAIVGWLRERGRAVGLELGPEAAETLVGLVGEDLGRLASEIEKAAVYAGGDRRVSEEVVRALAGETRGHEYWELTQALESGDRGESLRLLEQLLRGGDEPLVLLACVVGHLRNLWRALGGLAESADTRGVSRLLPRRRPDWAVERLMARAGSMGPAGLAVAVRRCFEVERALKTSAGSPRALLTLLVAELAR